MPPSSSILSDDAGHAAPVLKWCSQCHQEKPIHEFRRNGARRCRQCVAHNQRARRIARRHAQGQPIDRDWDRPIDRTQEKRCSHCRAVKPLDAFSRDRTGTSGRKAWCRACQQARVDARRSARGLPPLQRDAVIDPTKEKRCSRCRAVKPHSDFHRNRGMHDGYYAYCRACSIARKQEARVRAGLPPVQRIDRTQEQRCVRCRTVKPLHAFPPNRNDASRPSTTCLDCRAAWRRACGWPVDEDWDRQIDRTREKRCGRCRSVKPLADFAQDRHSRDGRQNRCRACCAVALRATRLRKGLPVRPRWDDSSLDRTQEKRCSRCHTVKPLADFYRKRRSADGHTSSCRACDAQRPASAPVARATKRCYACKAVKPVGEFNRHRSHADGHSSYCRRCDNARSRTRYARRRAARRQV